MKFLRDYKNVFEFVRRQWEVASHNERTCWWTQEKVVNPSNNELRKKTKQNPSNQKNITWTNTTKHSFLTQVHDRSALMHEKGSKRWNIPRRNWHKSVVLDTVIPMNCWIYKGIHSKEIIRDESKIKIFITKFYIEKQF